MNNQFELQQKEDVDDELEVLSFLEYFSFNFIDDAIFFSSTFYYFS